MIDIHISITRVYYRPGGNTAETRFTLKRLAEKVKLPLPYPADGHVKSNA